MRQANRLQWESRRLDILFCVDSGDIHGEREDVGEMMRMTLWDHVGETAFDDISGGGWTSSYTGAWLGRDVMDEYGDNIRAKLLPYLGQHDPSAGDRVRVRHQPAAPGASGARVLRDRPVARNPWPDRARGRACRAAERPFPPLARARYDRSTRTGSTSW